MRELPSGTVTFFFSDIEGSTKLLDELGAEAYAEALAEHRRLMREAFAAHGGVEVDTQGDAFFVAFPEAQGALAAAAQAQAVLAAGPVSVRMGIHSGEPLVTEEGYIGIDVHKGARVMSAGHGGQVLVSQATYSLLDGGNGLTELGRHRLKDLTEPQPLYQLGANKFPPLKTLYQSNLPVQPTPLVGREAELAEVLELLASTRLLTLTGAGGSGKTRLALQAAAELVDDYKDGVWWVSLAALRDSSLVEPTIAQTVGAKDGLAEYLRGKQALLLLDNFEQVVEAAPGIGTLLSEAGDVRVLATSRERLGIAAEQEYQVPTLAPTEAVALFTTRARQLKPGFESNENVEEICRRLEGLPLAVELAAARIKVLTPKQILERLGKSLDLLTAGARDAPERQQTLRATIEWSYDLLDEDEQRLFARLAVFAGSFDLAAAQAVCGAELDRLAALVDKSLLRQTDEGRFFMLETIREFALAQLERSAERLEVERRHRAYFVELSVAAARATGGYIRSVEDYARFELERENVRGALNSAVAMADGSATAPVLAALWSFWVSTGGTREAIRWGTAALELRETLPTETLSELLFVMGELMRFSGDLESAERFKLELLELARQGEEGAARRASGTFADLAEIALIQGEMAKARLLAEESLRLSGRGPRAIQARAEVAQEEGDLAAAVSLFAEAVSGYRGVHEVNLAHSLGSLGEAARRSGDAAQAWSAFHEAAALFERLGDQPSAADSLDGLAMLAFEDGRVEEAAVISGVTEHIRQESGATPWYHKRTLPNLPERALARGREMTLADAIAFIDSLD